MKIIISIINLLMAFIYCVFPTFQEALQPKPGFEANYKNLGVPLEDYYPNGNVARSAWDVEIIDDKLFVAAGDYDKNSGPVPIYYYDLTENIWIHSGTLPDEQIEHFKIIDNTLMTPGCDPRAGWEFGNIYIFKDHEWVTSRSIPGGIHQFDLVSFEGKIFAALGVSPGQFPIAVSEDGGETFRQVEMYKDGVPLDTSVPAGTKSAQIRTYDFFTLNGELFTFYCRYVDKAFTLEIYRYENNAFYYYCDLPQTLNFKRTTFRLFHAKTEFSGRLYFATGSLFVTSDLKTAEKIELPDNCIVTDIRVIEDSLYALAYSDNEDGSYRISVLCNNSGKPEQFRELLYFDFPCPALSFTYHNGTMYFGMGEGTLSEKNPCNGTILSVYVLG